MGRVFDLFSSAVVAVREKALDRELGQKYERPNSIIRTFSMPFLWFLGFLPSTISNAIFLAFSGKEGDTRTVFRNVGNFRALETMYTFHKRGGLNISSIFWENFLSNARSIRNRLFLVKEKLKTIIELFPNGQVCLLSIGSGSARPVLETCATLDGKSPAKIMLVDLDQNALNFSKNLARELGLNHGTEVQWVHGNFLRLERYCKNFKPNVVEVVGLLDYLSDKQVAFLLKKIFRVLVSGGYLITGNIAPNMEASFVTKAIHWPMVYRSPQKLTGLLGEAGFDVVEITQEPLKVHTVAIGRKT